MKEPLHEGERGECKKWSEAQHQKNQYHGHWPHHLLANEGEAMEAVTDFTFLGSMIPADSDSSHKIKRHLLLSKKMMTNHLKKQRPHLANKGLHSQSCGFSSSDV